MKDEAAKREETKNRDEFKEAIAQIEARKNFSNIYYNSSWEEAYEELN